MMTSGVLGGIDEIINSPVRFGIMAAVSRLESVEYRVVMDALDVSYTLLSKHVAILADAGYITVRKVASLGPRRTTFLRATRKGAIAYNTHVVALQQLVQGVDFAVDFAPDAEGVTP